jgi:acetyl-CoA C-acetyltransferase
MKEIVIASGARTAVGEFGGSLKGVKVVELGAIVIREALIRAGIRPVVSDTLKSYRPFSVREIERTELNKRYYQYDEKLTPVYIDEVIMGNGIQAGQGQSPARQAAIYAGIPEETNAYTVNKVCGSGMKAIALAVQAIAAGEAEIVVAGGMENMSNVPFGLPEARWGYRMTMPFGTITDLMVFDGLTEIFYGYHMGMTAENIASMYGITREEQDRFALTSHQRARAAINSGVLEEEIVPVLIPQRKGEPKVFKVDERPRETSLELLSNLPPVFKKDGTVTAGNASGINDAAAAVVVMTAEKARELGIKPLAKVLGYASGGVDPQYMGLGPIPAIRKLLGKLDMKIKDFGLIELNEAFAAQALCCIKELEIDEEICNVNGGAIAIGHPIGCTGARITYSLAVQMKRRGVRYGLASLCIGGGQGMAIALERY